MCGVDTCLLAMAWAWAACASRDPVPELPFLGLVVSTVPVPTGASFPWTGRGDWGCVLVEGHQLQRRPSWPPLTPPAPRLSLCLSQVALFHPCLLHLALRGHCGNRPCTDPLQGTGQFLTRAQPQALLGWPTLQARTPRFRQCLEKFALTVKEGRGAGGPRAWARRALLLGWQRPCLVHPVQLSTRGNAPAWSRPTVPSWSPLLFRSPQQAVGDGWQHDLESDVALAKALQRYLPFLEVLSQATASDAHPRLQHENPPPKVMLAASLLCPGLASHLLCRCLQGGPLASGSPRLSCRRAVPWRAGLPAAGPSCWATEPPGTVPSPAAGCLLGACPGASGNGSALGQGLITPEKQP